MAAYLWLTSCGESTSLSMRANVIPPALPGGVATGTGEEKFVKPTKHKIILKNLRSLSWWLLRKPTVPSDSTDLIHILRLLCRGQRRVWMDRVRQEQEKMSPPSKSVVPNQGSQSQAPAFPRALSTQPSTLHGCHLPSAVESYFCIYSFFQKINNFYSTSACALRFCII